MLATKPQPSSVCLFSLLAEASSFTKTPETGMLSSCRAGSETQLLLQGLTHKTLGGFDTEKHTTPT